MTKRNASGACMNAVGVANYMPGTEGFTMACFKAEDVPVGTKLYAAHPPQAAQPPTAAENGGKTGSPPGLLQDDSRKLFDALASKPDARLRVREAAEDIRAQAAQPEAPDDGELEAWRSMADRLLQGRSMSNSELRRAAHLLQNAYLFAIALLDTAARERPAA